ncbi:hypothetical protein [Kitasatospora sp. KL5]|uniref:hypothetical protein n=1 Tax=Kitasatospora sp. KL5 TaxID=3425125 RepID=UPI003D6EC1A4
MTSTSAGRSLRGRAGWLTMTVLATGVALVSAPYLTLDPDTFLAEQRAAYLPTCPPWSCTWAAR